MKKVIIKCVSNNGYTGRYHVMIFDRCCNKVFDDYTKAGIVILYLKKDVYKLIVVPLYPNSSIMITNFMVTDGINYLNINFSLNDNSLKITAKLVDENYNNLPIERGEIKLWQNHIQ